MPTEVDTKKSISLGLLICQLSLGRNEVKARKQAKRGRGNKITHKAVNSGLLSIRTPILGVRQIPNLGVRNNF